jgi:two-component system cell cycle sensor histidine kinase PleC
MTPENDALMARLAALEAENGRLRSKLAQQQALQTESEALTSQFLSVVSHELRTPIHVLMGFLRILQKGVGGPVTDAQRGFLERAMGVTDVLARLVNDILDLSQVRAGTFRLHPGPCDVPACVANAVQTMATLADQKAIRLDVAVDADLPSAWADGDRLEQVLLNLISNAIKFTPEGGAVTVSATADTEAVRVAVSDTGVGIAPEDLPLLFRPFTQLDMSLTREVGGVGIGLSICSAIVHAHGGRIQVESELGRGSRFWFVLPLRPPAAVSDHADSA